MVEHLVGRKIVDLDHEVRTHQRGTFPAAAGTPRSPAPRTVLASAPRRRASRADRSHPSGSLGEVREIEIDGERDEADEAQRAADAAAPEFDAIDGAIRPDRIASGKMIGRALGGRASADVANVSLSPSDLSDASASRRCSSSRSRGLLMRAEHRPVRRRNPSRQAVDAAAMMRERSGMTLGTCMRWVWLRRCLA